MTLKSLELTCLAVGAGLTVIAFVAMNLRPFAFGDTRVFGWIAVNGILTVVGLSMVIGVGIMHLRCKFRRGGKG